MTPTLRASQEPLEESGGDREAARAWTRGGGHDGERGGKRRWMRNGLREITRGGEGEEEDASEEKKACWLDRKMDEGDR